MTFFKCFYIIIKVMEERNKIIDIYPTKLTRRLLVFLADTFIFLILAVFLFEMCAKPIFVSLPNFNNKFNEATKATSLRNDVLYENEILFYANEDAKNLGDSISYTSLMFLKYYTFDTNEDKYDVVYRYFVILRNTEVEKVNKLYSTYGINYFDTTKFTEKGTYDFKDNVKNLIKPYFVHGDEVSKDGQTYIDDFKEVFLSIYSGIISDIKVNDLRSVSNPKEVTFNQCSEIISSFDEYRNNGITICVFIVFIFSWFILFFAIPFINYKGQTIGQIILKIEHIDLKRIDYLSKNFRVTKSMFDLLNSGCVILLIPSISYGFGKVFLLNVLFSVEIIALLFLIVELIFLLTNKFAKTLKELTTNSIVIDSSSMDDYYREMNYGK